MGTITYTLPTPGSTLNDIADPEIVTALQTILTWANGNIDASNVSAVLAQAAGVNQAGQTVKGAISNTGPGTRTNVAYGALSDAADQVTVVLPTNGLILVRFMATWAESVAGAARAAIFIGANQLKIEEMGAAAPVVQAAATGAAANINQNNPLTSFIGGLVSGQASAYTGDVATGQVLGMFGTGIGGDALAVDMNGVSLLTANGFVTVVGGPCEIDNLPAGTYTISVQYKASSGTVTASNRRLKAAALSFA